MIEVIASPIRLATPLGLGKANLFLNALYHKVKACPDIQLEIYTALSLEIPVGKSSLEKRFLEPFTARVFKDYPELMYMKDIRANKLPDNIKVSEFYVKSGSILGQPYAQQQYSSVNYSHVARDLMQHKINVLVQMVSKCERGDQTLYSMSCNPEVSLDLFPYFKEEKQKGNKTLFIGQVHPDLPHMVNDAELEADDFDMIIDNDSDNQCLFGPPDMPVSATDYLIGLHCSTLIPDAGTLQLGISSLSDAIVYCLQLRHQHNKLYQDILEEIHQAHLTTQRFTGPFDIGLYGNSEMFVDGFMDLYLAKILKRKVYQHEGLQKALNENKFSPELNSDSLDKLHSEGIIHYPLNEEDLDFLLEFGIFKQGTYLSKGKIYAPNGHKLDPDYKHPKKLALIIEACLGSSLQGGVILHGGFFLGPQLFYQRLKNLSAEEAKLFNMTAISYVNNLYGDEELKRQQRIKSRFINTVFKVSLLGSATCDALADGRIVSGIGGQYNFVVQAHELEGARSILVFKSTYTSDGQTQSNIVFNYGHCSIPRHLRDIFITEYGIADLRGRSDADCVKAMLGICDSRFQDNLLEQAKEAGKVEADYQLPESYRHNSKEEIRNKLAAFQTDDNFPSFPFGSDFTKEERVLLKALKGIKKHAHSKFQVICMALSGIGADATEYEAYLKRMNLDKAQSFKEKVERALLISALKKVKL